MDYALGQTPLVPSADPVSSIVDPSGNLGLQFTISDPAPADVTYTVWSSTTPDLATGAPIATKHGTAPWGGSATVTSTPSTGSTTITTIDDPSPPASNGFLWLTVSPR